MSGTKPLLPVYTCRVCYDVTFTLTVTYELATTSAGFQHGRRHIHGKSDSDGRLIDKQPSYLLCRLSKTLNFLLKLLR